MGLLAAMTLAALALLLTVGGDGVGAFESYHDPNQNDVGYCTGCHAGFAGGRSDTLHALHTGGTSTLGTITGNCSLCHTGSGRDNPFSMWATGDAGDGLGCAGCHGRNYGETIGADYRGFPIAGLPKASAYGLRDHHDGAGITACVNCHGSAPGGTPQAENIAPPYYARTDVLGGNLDPCADLLDNDGDGLYDANDPDCVANTPPVANGDAYTTDEDVTLNVPAPGVLGNDTDDDGDSLTAVLNTGAANGSLTFNSDGSFTYTPNPDYFGPDSFTYRANDGLADSNIATVGLTVNSVNDAPTADANGPYTGIAGTAVTFDGSASGDIDGTIVSYAWDFGDGGTGTGVTPSYTYAAAGSYTVTLTVTDDGGLSDTATSSATIDPAPNVPPTADANGPYGATVGTPILFDGSGSVDTDGTIVSYDWDFGDGATGTGVAPTHAYATDGTFTVTLTVTDNDGATGTDTSSAVITVVPNVPPTADANGPYTGTAGVPVVFDGSGSVDTDGTIVAYDWDFGDGSTGTGVAPSHTYAAEGTYTVTLTVTDDGGLTDTATSTATIDPAPNVPPIADANGPYSGTVGVPVVFDGSGSVDTDGTIVAYDWDFGDGSTGSGVTPSHIYAAAGSYTVTLTVTDNDGATDSATSTANIAAANVPPTADANGPYSGTAGVAVVFDGSGSVDTDGAIVAYDWDFGDGSTGSGVTPSHTYAAAGSYTVSLTVTDDGGLSDTAFSSATIDPAPNTPPTAVDDSYSTTAGTTLNVAAPGVLANDSDADGDPLTAVIGTGVSNGSLTLNANGSFVYTPNGGFIGTDSFTYVANDGFVDSLPATVTITVSPAGTVLAVNDFYTTSAGTTLNVAAPGVLANDVRSSDVWAFKRSNPANGSASISYSGALTYIPNSGFTGTDSFMYDFWDSAAGKWSNVATVTIEVGGAANVPPTADANGPYSGTVGVMVTFDSSGSTDTDGTIVSYDWDFGDGSTGSGVAPMHAYSAAGTYTVTLTVTDDGGLTDSDSSTATIADVPNVPPTADANGPYSGTVGVMVTFDGSGSTDTDGTIVSYDWDFGDGSTGSGVAPTHIYAAEGSYTVTLTVTDDDGATDSDTSSAVIDPAPNVPPTADANGPYSGTVGIAVAFDGSGSFDSDGTIVAYEWDFGDGSTGSGVMPMHTYSAAGTYTVTLTVTDDDGATDSDTSSAVIEPANEIVDLDIDNFSAPNRIKLDKLRPVKLTLKVENNGNVDIGPGYGATATIVGMQNGKQIFSTTIPIWDLLSDGSTVFEVVITDRKIFEPGQVKWTATLNVVGDSDVDQATAYSTVTDRHQSSAGLLVFGLAGAYFAGRRPRRRRE